MPPALAAIRLQTAIVRALLDDVERTLPAHDPDAPLSASPMSIELADELERLAARLRQGAESVRASAPPAPEANSPRRCA